MSFHGAFASSVLGMKSQSYALNIIGNNVANVNTGGFKETETRFSSILGNTYFNQFGHQDIGGTTPMDTQRISKQGFIQASERELDVAISGNGFFILSETLTGGGETFYTRDGSFEIKTQGTATATADDNSIITVQPGYLVDKNGYFVMGWAPETDGTFSGTGTLQALRIDQFAFTDSGTASTQARLNLNLKADAAVNETYTYNIDVYDSNGKNQSVPLTFTKTGTNAWSMDMTTTQDAVAQVDTVTLAGTIEANDTYSVTVGAYTAQYTVTGAEADIDAVRTALVNQINTDPNMSALVTAAAGGAGQLTLTAKTAGTSFTSSATSGQGNANVAQIDTITLGGAVDVGDVVRATINGFDVDYTVQPGDVALSDIRDGLIGAINGDINVNGAVTATINGANGLFVTSDTAGTPFTMTVSDPTDPGADTTITRAANTANYTANTDNTAASVVTTANVAPTLTTAVGNMTFNSKGGVATPTSAFNLAMTFAGGTNATVALDVSEFTQFAGAYNVVSYWRDGYVSADMVSVRFDSEGHIVGGFEDNSFRDIYKVPLAVFPNADLMQMKNGNTFLQTTEAGTRRVVSATADGQAILLPNAHEISNVDLADQFSRMIMTQNAYNSNATAFRTVDEMTQTAKDMKR